MPTRYRYSTMFSSRIFGHTGQVADDIIYVNWLNMVRAGLCGLEFYSPSTETWRQVNIYCIKVLIAMSIYIFENKLSSCITYRGYSTFSNTLGTNNVCFMQALKY